MKSYVIVGAGSRCDYMFVDNLYQNLPKEDVVYLGVYDVNPVRSKRLCDKINKLTGASAKPYDDFDKMLDEENPNGVIVTSTDSTHHEYIVKALERGCDVISEKPMTNTFERCLAIRNAEKRSGKNVTVTFNCRFMPYFAKIKELVSCGKIGKVLAMNYEYRLGFVHGGDYFKRWHRFMDFSQSMFLHKSTHHLDIANWIIGEEPETVTALADRVYYGDETKPHGERCSTCPYKDTCLNYEDAKGNPVYSELYFGKAEESDGYIRDHCVFKSDTDIYDNMAVIVRYAGGALLTYTLNMFSSNEGYKITITGETGTLEASEVYMGEGKTTSYTVKIIRPNGTAETYNFPVSNGSHGGGDAKLVKMVFGKDTEDPLNQKADSYDGVKSAMIGVSAVESVKRGTAIRLKPYLDQLRQI